jgi:methylenetetrahydrofolate reductase (NADPH)
MAAALIHPNWDKPLRGITDGFSLEMTAKDEGSLREAAPLILVDTPIAVTFLPGEDIAARVKATVAVRELGVEPMPHFSARRITSEDDFEGYLRAVVGRAGVSRAFIVAGDPPAPIGPYFDTSALIATGAFERSGIKAIGIGGHPEGHPDMTEQQCWDVLGKKVREIEAGMVGINTNMIAGADSPFGGVRWSGHGAEDGPEGVLACMVAKAVHEG